MAETLEQKALKMDADLAAAGSIVRDKDDRNLTAGRGVALRNFAMKAGFGFARRRVRSAAIA